ncbi:MAG TPA: flavodoxin domain-containing protein [Nocardioidaceae bacterium]|nr:flavodoxin domain-containing protein [Nocardioidaceae bacterium]
MKALVVYESMFGNTEQVARAVATGLGRHLDVELVAVANAPDTVSDVDLVVVGGPTHAFSMTRQATRVDAVSQGASHGTSETGLREWLATLPAGSRSLPVATFDTRVDKARHLPGSAAKAAAKVVRRRGYLLAARPESFYVADVAGPLIEGELDRAAAWGETLTSGRVVGCA